MVAIVKIAAAELFSKKFPPALFFAACVSSLFIRFVFLDYECSEATQIL